MNMAWNIFRGVVLLFAMAIIPATAGYTLPKDHWCSFHCGTQTGIVGLHLAALFFCLFLVSFPVAKLLRRESWRLPAWGWIAIFAGIPAGLILHRVLNAYYDSCYWLLAIAPSPLRAIAGDMPVFREWRRLLSLPQYFNNFPGADFYYGLAWTLALAMVFAIWAWSGRK